MTSDESCAPGLSDRFWSKVRKTKKCWVWIGSIGACGYGQMFSGQRNRSPLLAHRVSWEIHYGSIPPGLCVLHRCDNPRCVRPNHLFLGTRRDNTQDMLSKGRMNAKLTVKSVARIRSLVSRGSSASEVARIFHVAKRTVLDIIHRKTWVHETARPGPQCPVCHHAKHEKLCPVQVTRWGEVDDCDCIA